MEGGGLGVGGGKVSYQRATRQLHLAVQHGLVFEQKLEVGCCYGPRCRTLAVSFSSERLISALVTLSIDGASVLGSATLRISCSDLTSFEAFKRMGSRVSVPSLLKAVFSTRDRNPLSTRIKSGNWSATDWNEEGSAEAVELYDWRRETILVANSTMLTMDATRPMTATASAMKGMH